MRALLSVANRDGIAAFARDLQALDVELFATDGTREHLAGDGVEVALRLRADDRRRRPSAARSRPSTTRSTPASSPAATSRPSSRSSRAQGIGPIDIVVVNVKPFAPAVGAKLVGIDEAIEMIDVGGAALLGAAARNAAGVAAVGRPGALPQVLAELREHGQVSAELRAQLAAEAFGTVAAYHAEIAAYLNQISGNTFPKRLAIVLEKVDDLRYGENPHQRAAFYRETTHRSGTLADATQLQGDRPSFNNLLDLDAAYRIARDYTAPTVAIVKHTDPVGLASHDELVEAYRHALETDPVASFGGIVGVNRELDGATAREIAANSYEAVVAPGLQPVGARHPPREGTASSCSPSRPTRPRACATTASPTSTSSGSPAASSSRASTSSASIAAGSRSSPSRRPTLEELTDLLFAWRAVRHVRSNAIVLARNGATVGIGAAQASRQVSVEIALRRAGDRAKPAVMARDAYFPFPDGIQMAAKAGVTAIIQPGGSIRDEMAIEVADRHHLAMVFTGRRHFRH